ncbi:hypothetical protein [Blastopirellula marina]|uniref:hypothetical protein n=1 Tax=Blastopirellula marina TaxID=124 RepID=UPI0011B039CF|nr:hypothetical protein [Blastopirellula marina]
MPLWAWLPLSISAVYLGTPSDPISEWMGMGINLLWLWLSAAAGSSRNSPLRIAAALLLTIPLGYLTILLGPHYRYIGFDLQLIWGGIYMVANLGLGFFAWRIIPVGRFRIFAGLSVGYLLGSFLFLIGAVPLGAVGSIVGYLAVKKTLPNAET